MDDFKEFQGKSLDEAIRAACSYFDAQREKLEIDIIQDAKNGIFGLVGARKAIVRARRAQLKPKTLPARPSPVRGRLPVRPEATGNRSRRLRKTTPSATVSFPQWRKTTPSATVSSPRKRISTTPSATASMSPALPAGPAATTAPASPTKGMRTPSGLAAPVPSAVRIRIARIVPNVRSALSAKTVRIVRARLVLPTSRVRNAAPWKLRRSRTCCGTARWSSIRTKP